MVVVIQKEPPQFYFKMATAIIVDLPSHFRGTRFTHLMLVESFYENAV